MHLDNKMKLTAMGQEFAKGMEPDVKLHDGPLVVDPMSAYFNALGYENKLLQVPSENPAIPVLIIEFEDGTRFIPGGSKIPHPSCVDWMWLEPGVELYTD